MKKMTYTFEGTGTLRDLNNLNESINSLSGVLRTDLDLQNRSGVSYVGDKMPASALGAAAQQAGFTINVNDEQSVDGVHYKTDIRDL